MRRCNWLPLLHDVRTVELPALFVSAPVILICGQSGVAMKQTGMLTVAEAVTEL